MATNKKSSQIILELDKKRVLYFNLNSLIDLEEKIGVPMAELSNVSLTIKNIRTFLHAGLCHEDEELTEEMVGALIDLDNLADVQEKLTKAFNKATSKNS